MDLSRGLAPLALTRVSVLLVEAPGWAVTRWAAERELRRRGWRRAASAADADVLLVCGATGPRLAAAAEGIWRQLPGPRAREGSLLPEDVAPALDRARAALLDGPAQSEDANHRPADPVSGPTARLEDDDESDDESDDTGNEAGNEAEDTDHGDMDHGDMDHGDMDHGDMDHGGMEMAPDGIPLAGSGGTDRDGLEMDVLSVPLGPVLPAWPAGLVLHCSLSGDVVVSARAEHLGSDGGADGPPMTPFGGAAALLDRAADVLVLSGRTDLATAACQLRERLAFGGEDGAGSADVDAHARDLDRLLRQVRRSRLLRWSLGGLDALDAEAHGLDGRLSGTIHDRLVAVLDDARAALGGGAPTVPDVPLEVLPRLVEGLELGAVRLLVAGLDLRGSAAREPAVRR